MVINIARKHKKPVCAVAFFTVILLITLFFYTHSTSYILRKNSAGKYLHENGKHYSLVMPTKQPLDGMDEMFIAYDAPFETQVAELLCVQQKNSPVDGALQLRVTLTNHSTEMIRIYFGRIVEQRINGAWYRCNTPPAVQTSLHYPLEPEETMNIPVSLIHVTYCYSPIEFKNFSPGHYRVLLELERDRYVPLEFTLTRAQIRAAEKAWRQEKKAAE